MGDSNVQKIVYSKKTGPIKTEYQCSSNSCGIDVQREKWRKEDEEKKKKLAKEKRKRLQKRGNQKNTKTKEQV